MEIDLEEPTRAHLAALFGKSIKWVGDQRSLGKLPVDGASWAENLEAFLESKTGGGQQSGGGLRYDVEKARLTKEQADEKAMDNAERRGDLASRADLTGAVISVIKVSVARLMQVPAAVAQGNAGLRTKIETAIVDALRDLSLTRVEAAMGGGLDEEDAPGDDEPDGDD